MTTQAQQEKWAEEIKNTSPEMLTAFIDYTHWEGSDLKKERDALTAEEKMTFNYLVMKMYFDLLLSGVEFDMPPSNTEQADCLYEAFKAGVEGTKLAAV